MKEIKNVTLEFNCPQKLSSFTKSNNEFYCEKCSKNIIDFTNKTPQELSQLTSIPSANICGLFKKSQLSNKFIKYAASSILITASTFTANSQDINLDSLDLLCTDEIGATKEEDVFFGMIVENQAYPIGGFDQFYEAIHSKLKWPDTLTIKGKVFVQFVVDTTGFMGEFEVVKTFDIAAEAAAIKALKETKYKFIPATQKGKTIRSRLIIPIIFNTESRK